MAVAYTKIPVTAGQILAAPTSISVSRRSNVMAITIPLTSGVIVQAFRVTPTGLVAIPVNGQPAAARTAISVSPDGTYIFVGAPVVNQPAIEGWKYNTATGEYDKIAAFVAANDTARWTADIEWLSDNVFARISAFQSGSTYRGGVSGWRINANDTLDNFFNRLEPSSYRAECGRLSPNGNTLLVGFSGALNLNDAYSWDGNSLAFVRRVTSGGSRFFEYLRTSDHIFASRTGSGAGLNIQNVATIPGGNILSTAQNLSSVNGVQTRVLADEYLLNHATTGPAFFLRPDPASAFAPSGPPPGLEEVSGFTSQWTWATNPSLNRTLAGYANGTTDLRVYVNPIEPADVHLFAEAPAASATILTTENTSAEFFALAPTATATIETLGDTTVDLFAMAPVATATIETQANTTVDLFAEAPTASATILMLGSEDQVRYVVPMAQGVAVMTAEPVSVAVQVLPRPYIRASFGALRAAATVSYNMDINLGAGFGALTASLSGAPDPSPVIAVGFSALYSAAFAAGDPAPVIALGFQPLYSAGLLAEPVRINFQMGFGALATAIELDKPSMEAEVAVGFQPLYSAAILDNPIAAFVGGSFGALQTTAIASGPVVIDMTPGFQRLQSDALVFVPILTTGAMGFQPLATLIDVVIPNVVRLSPGFRPLETFLDVMVPNVARLAPGFAALESDGFTMVPNTIRLAPGFQRLASDGYTMVPSTASLSIGFGPMSASMFAASTFSSDIRTVFGRLGTRIVVSPPVKLLGDIVLPFMETEGRIVVDYYVEGNFTLPFAEVAGAAEVSHRMTGDVVLPFMDAAGEMAVFYTASGDIEMPGLDVSGSIMIVYRLAGDAVLPYLEVLGRGSDAGRSPTGNAPTLMGAGQPQSMLRTGGGIFLNFDSITIG